MYSVVDYDAMLADTVRSAAYIAAIGAAVRPGDVVVEIGTGVGFFAVAAARAGARRVYAIELNPAIALGPDVAKANGCSDSITFVHGRSELVSLPERGDVLIEDLRGVLPLEEGHIRAVVDARSRHLRAGARTVPVRDTLWAAPCRADSRFLEAHVTSGDAPFGIDRRAVEAKVRHAWHRARTDAAQLFGPAAQWGAIDYAAVTSGDVDGRAEWTMTREGRIDGIAVWFDADLGFGCGFTNAPGAPKAIYGQAFFPFVHALDVVPGDRLSTELRAKLAEDTYVWSWNTSFEPPAGSGRGGARFRQSSLGGLATSLTALHRRRDDHRPRPARSAVLLRGLLMLADGTRSLREIADALSIEHPARFASPAAALRYATEHLAALEEDEALGEPR